MGIHAQAVAEVGVGGGALASGIRAAARRLTDGTTGTAVRVIGARINAGASLGAKGETFLTVNYALTLGTLLAPLTGLVAGTTVTSVLLHVDTFTGGGGAEAERSTTAVNAGGIEATL